VLAAWPAGAAPGASLATQVQVYSDLCEERESGDFEGHRITLVQREGRLQARVEWSEEGPLSEARIRQVTLAPDGALAFRTSTEIADIRFRGRRTDRALAGSLMLDYGRAGHIAARVRLPRVSTRRIPACR
jgi:hypothetical protein